MDCSGLALPSVPAARQSSAANAATGDSSRQNPRDDTPAPAIPAAPSPLSLPLHVKKIPGPGRCRAYEPIRTPAAQAAQKVRLEPSRIQRAEAGGRLDPETVCLGQQNGVDAIAADADLDSSGWASILAGTGPPIISFSRN
ncbi:MAG: hypothetical protein JO108_25595 [Acidobacteriaceae bacterium]|nr:hypothetical protein [Acidobacteriaceae bacterium]